MRETLQKYRPRLKWYHYLVILYLGLPVGESASSGPYVMLGSLLGGFIGVWLVVAGIRRLRTGTWKGLTMEADDA